MNTTIFLFFSSVIPKLKDKELLSEPAAKAGLNSAVVVPILHDGESHGLLVFYGKQPLPQSFDVGAFTLFTQRCFCSDFDCFE